jgi:hypothetical protein
MDKGPVGGWFNRLLYNMRPVHWLVVGGLVVLVFFPHLFVAGLVGAALVMFYGKRG